MSPGAPLLVIAGPTASGKTDCAVRLARRWAERGGAELVSADSQQIYRHFDLGTAKPDAATLAAVPHHLISVIEPDDPAPFSAARYAALADAAIADIRGRGKAVIVVGGTGLYLRALLHGIVPAPSADPVLRARLSAEAEQVGWPALHERLRALDPESAARISPNDPVRIVRALELHALTGQRPSALRAKHGFQEQRHRADFHVLAPPRDVLDAAIAARTERMFDRGLVEETQRLVAQGFRDTAPMRSVGYRQALAVVEGRMSEADARVEVARETRRYAKRQLTWFRRVEGAHWHAPPYPEEL